MKTRTILIFIVGLTLTVFTTTQLSQANWWTLAVIVMTSYFLFNNFTKGGAAWLVYAVLVSIITELHLWASSGKYSFTTLFWIIGALAVGAIARSMCELVSRQILGSIDEDDEIPLVETEDGLELDDNSCVCKTDSPQRVRWD